MYNSQFQLTGNLEPKKKPMVGNNLNLAAQNINKARQQVETVNFQIFQLLDFWFSEFVSYIIE